MTKKGHTKQRGYSCFLFVTFNRHRKIDGYRAHGALCGAEAAFFADIVSYAGRVILDHYGSRRTNVDTTSACRAGIFINFWYH
jgi:hypothetical protein